MRPKTRLRSYPMLGLAALFVVAGGAPAGADFVAYETPAGAIPTGGTETVSATVQFTTSADTITVVLNNTLANPNDVAQNISGLFFTVSTGQTSGSINQGISYGMSRTVNDNGTYTDHGTTSPTGWDYQTSGAQVHLNDLGGGQPAQTILGQPDSGGTYSGANKSIAGNGPHNPFLYGPVTFTLDVNGVTAASTITAVTFAFGTTAGGNVVGVQSVPEPSSLALAGIGLGGLFVVLRRGRRPRPAA